MEPKPDDRVWPAWMPPQEIALYRRNRWRVPTGKLISRTGYREQTISGYRVHHVTQWVGMSVCTWYYEPVPQDGVK